VDETGAPPPPVTNPPLNEIPTIAVGIERYLDTVRLARSQHTAATYTNAMNAFKLMLAARKITYEKALITSLNEDAVGWFAAYLKHYSSSTEALYLTATAGFYEFLAAERLADVNLPRLRLLIRQRSRRPGQRLPQFPRDAIEHILHDISNAAALPVEDKTERLRNLRDKAFLLTLADTGLRVHEACNLHRGDLDWNEGKAIIVGKGDREAVVRFSSRAISSLKEYLSLRATLDGSSGRPLASLPLFARHDRGAGVKTKPITTATGRNIVIDWVKKILGPEAVGTITPHSFRHYFVTRVLTASGNLKLAQELARHRNIAVTQRYAHLSDDELDKGYMDAVEGE
jgi:integrase/recombinase XerC